MSHNSDNVKGHEFSNMTAEEQRKIASAGGKASAEARRRKKALRQCLEELLEMEYKTKNGEIMSNAEAMASKAVKSALNGDWKAWELVRDTAGQKPVDKVMVAEIDAGVIEDVENIINKTINDEQNTGD